METSATSAVLFDRLLDGQAWVRKILGHHDRMYFDVVYLTLLILSVVMDADGYKEGRVCRKIGVKMSPIAHFLIWSKSEAFYLKH
jgi:hypothetical protein